MKLSNSYTGCGGERPSNIIPVPSHNLKENNIVSIDMQSVGMYTVLQETFEGERLSDFMVLWLFMKAFSTKFGTCMVFFGTAKASNLRKFCPKKLYFSSIGESFLPQNFSAMLYIRKLLSSLGKINALHGYFNRLSRLHTQHNNY